MWKKRETQAFVTRLRRTGYKVDKTLTGYTCFENDNLVFSALEGRRNYIVRLNNKYITTQQESVSQ
jgi:D-alanyl-D-alanine carboxypeptidase